MIRATGLVAALALLLLAAPAQAFEMCDHNGTTVTATFGTDTASTIAVSGGAIVTEAGQCDGATVANTDTIVIETSASREEELTIDLSGGPFLGGVTNEAGGSDEIEIQAPSAGGFDKLNVRGHDGSADHVTLGGTTTQKAINLNANEADGIDADVTAGDWFVGLQGRGGNDALSDGGGDATGPSYDGAGLEGGPGDDTLDCGGSLRTGQGNDTARFRSGDDCFLSYDDAPGPVRLALAEGAGGDWGGTLGGHDGHGTTDTYVGRPFSISGSSHADLLNGSALRDRLHGSGGTDTINGGGGDDDLTGGAASDTMHGDAGDDEIRGDGEDDFLFGDDGNDIVDGSLGDDVEYGGDGDDRLRQTGFNMSSNEELPNGKDDLHGGPGTDSLEYAEPGAPTFGLGLLLGRTAPVTVDLDDVADDGAAGEGDNAHSDVEDIVGGLANDTLTGDGDANVLSGFDGADTLRGGDGDDTLKGLGSRSGFAPMVEADADDEGDDIDGGAGNDTVDANEGDDAIAARDGVAENVDCGPGEDTGTRDASDVLTACEGLAAPAESPPPTPPADPPAVTPPVVVPPVVVPPVVVPPAPKVATLLSLPSSRRCASRRKFTVRVRREIRGTVRRVQIFVNGKRVKSVTGRRIALPIDLRGLPKGRVRVRLRVELNDGRVATDTRTYRTCATKKRRGQFGRRRRG